MNKEIVRRHSISLLISFLIELEDWKKEYPDKAYNALPPNEILKKYFEDPCNYDELLASYHASLKSGEDNQEFAWAYRISSKFCLSVTDEIKVFYFQQYDRALLRKVKLFPWEYPFCIAKIGCRNGHSDREIINDFKNLPYLLFYLKYDDPNGKKNLFFQTGEETYHISDFLKVKIDSHISFLTTSESDIREKYIADAWFYENDEIMSDMMFLSTVKFGEKYKAFWCP